MFTYFEYLESIHSTNEYLKGFVDEGVPRVAVAEEQTQGKGQHGRSWYSPAGEGLYVSYLFYPGWETSRSEFLNMTAALAVVRAVRRQGGEQLSLRIKLPNDVLIDEKKVCGILTEMSSFDRINWAIVGIGINLYQKSFPAAFEHRATSLALQGVTIRHPLDLCDDLTRELGNLYRRVARGQWQEVRREFEKETQESSRL